MLGCLGASLAVTPARAQTRIANAVTETRPLAGPIADEVGRVAAGRTPAWIGYRVSIKGGDLRLCDAPVHLEPATELLVLARVDAGAVERLRLFTPDCDLDLGGLPLVWLDGATADASVAWLDRLAHATASDSKMRSRLVRPAIAALGLHATPAASNALIALARTDGPTWLRREAVQWLARSHEPKAVAFFEEILR